MNWMRIDNFFLICFYVIAPKCRGFPHQGNVATKGACGGWRVSWCRLKRWAHVCDGWPKHISGAGALYFKCQPQCKVCLSRPQRHHSRRYISSKVLSFSLLLLLLFLVLLMSLFFSSSSSFSSSSYLLLFSSIIFSSFQFTVFSSLLIFCGFLDDHNEASVTVCGGKLTFSL